MGETFPIPRSGRRAWPVWLVGGLLLIVAAWLATLAAGAARGAALDDPLRLLGAFSTVFLGIISLIAVVLPAPFSPKSANTTPGGT